VSTTYVGGTTSRDVPGVKFPITDSPQQWIDAGRASNQLDPAHCRFSERFEPHQGIIGLADSWHGAYVHPLAMLQILANESMHRDDGPVTLPGADAGISRNALPAEFDEYLAGGGNFHPQPRGDPSRTMEIGNEVMGLQLYAGADPHT
jgi:hypothetical protein